MADTLPVFYDVRMVAAGHGRGSPSPGKPALAVEDWLRSGLPVHLQPVTPVTFDELCRAHSPEFVARILSCRAQNGFRNRDPEVAASLPWTSGAMLSAARLVLYTGRAACAPVSGFHHASYSRAVGFCTFNGLMVTALALLAGGSKKVGILDCDYHYGDGTASILEMLQPKGILHWSAGRRYRTGASVSAFMKELQYRVSLYADCDVVLYQAGADPHVNDPLGGFLTTQELWERDGVVFEQLANLDVPVVWNLAGGYQEERDGSIPKVLEIHRNTVLEAMHHYGFQEDLSVAV